MKNQDGHWVYCCWCWVERTLQCEDNNNGIVCSQCTFNFLYSRWGKPTRNECTAAFLCKCVTAPEGLYSRTAAYHTWCSLREARGLHASCFCYDITGVCLMGWRLTSGASGGSKTKIHTTPLVLDHDTCINTPYQ